MTQLTVVTGYDGECLYRDAVTENLTEYCERWGYDLITKFDGWEPTTRHLYWRKLQLIASVMDGLPDGAWLLWVDADCMIVNMRRPIDRFLDDYDSISDFDLAVTGPFPPCEGCGNPVYNAGILLIRKCQWSQEFLQEWWDTNEWYVDCFGHEHGGDNEVLTCKLIPEYIRAFASEPVDTRRTRIAVIDLKDMGWIHNKDGLDQFILHFYGSEEREKLNLFQLNKDKVIR